MNRPRPNLNRSRRRPPRPDSDRGYAYLLALFMVMTLLITSQLAMSNILTEGRRQREEDMIWRGQQFVRAIRLYYHKTGHYPSDLDDLKKGMPELHFLRYAAYKDPMKKDDGAWRFIYVNAAGQIIGSVKYATLQQMAIMDLNGGKMPGAKQDDQNGQPGIPASALADQSNTSSSDQSTQNPAQGQPNPPTTPPPGATPDGSANAANTPPNPGSPVPNPTPQSTSPTPTNAIGAPAGPGGVNTNLNNQSLAALAALKPTGPVDGPVLGGFLSGVASTVEKPSIRVYNGGVKYDQWEFIWNPVEDQARAVQQGFNNPAAGLAGQPGQAIGTGAAGMNILGNSGTGANPAVPGSPTPFSSPGTNPSQSGQTPP
jgi:hypothetical protein